MRWSFDFDADALYVRLSEASPERQIELSDGTIVDLDAAGAVVGIEVLSFHAGWDPRLVLTTLPVDPDDEIALRFLATHRFGAPVVEGRTNSRTTPTTEAHETLQSDELVLSA